MNLLFHQFFMLKGICCSNFFFKISELFLSLFFFSFSPNEKAQTFEHLPQFLMDLDDIFVRKLNSI